MEVIKTSNLTKTYTNSAIEVHAINGIDLSVQKGEFTAIKGPSGCGKTTLLNMLGGLDNPTSGVIEIDGLNIANMSSKSLIDFRLHNIGFVFQAYNLIPVLTAKENVSFIMLLQKIDAKDREKRAMQLLKDVGLAGKENNRPGQLSGGQQQRVAVARALASRPKFVLADEPTANLDSHSTENLLDIMAELNEKEKMTFIFSTHDDRVINKAKRVITLEDGKIIADETRA